MTTVPKMACQQMIIAISDSLSDLAISDNWENGDDKNHDMTQQSQLSEDEKPGLVMGTITKTVEQHTERFQHKWMKLEELTQPGRGDAADNFHECDKSYGTSESSILAVIKPQTDHDTAAAASTIFEDLLE